MMFVHSGSPPVLAALDGHADLWLALAALVVILVLTLVVATSAARARSGNAPLESEGSVLGSYTQVYTHLVKEGRAVPLPATFPSAPRGVSTARVQQVEGLAQDLRAVAWGTGAPLMAPASEPEAQAAFDAALGRLRVVRAGNEPYAKLVHTFAMLPAPYCLVGAAEMMLTLSYQSDFILYVPQGVMQALLFVVQAQCASPLHPEALVAQTRILAAGRSADWVRQAERTLALLEHVAPDHPRLPWARFACHLGRQDYEQALTCNRAMQDLAPTADERHTAMKLAADMLLRLKRYDEALVAYDATLASDPYDEWAWHNKSLVLLAVGRPQEAYVCNHRALSISQFGAAQNTRQRIVGELRMRNLEPPEALEWL